MPIRLLTEPLRRENHWLDMRQEPEKARVVVRGKEKGETPLGFHYFLSHKQDANASFPIDRKPVDPPPIVQLKVSDPYNDTWSVLCMTVVVVQADGDLSSYLHNPYYFCACTLWDAELDQPKKPDTTPGAAPPEALQGQLVSSLHRLKDFDNTGTLAQSLYRSSVEIHHTPLSSIKVSAATTSTRRDGNYI